MSNQERSRERRERRQTTCAHDWTATFQGGDTYKCQKCGLEMDMTEDDGD